jgi:hypothetical protein
MVEEVESDSDAEEM